MLGCYVLDKDWTRASSQQIADNFELITAVFQYRDELAYRAQRCCGIRIWLYCATVMQADDSTRRCMREHVFRNSVCRPSPVVTDYRPHHPQQPQLLLHSLHSEPTEPVRCAQQHRCETCFSLDNPLGSRKFLIDELARLERKPGV